MSKSPNKREGQVQPGVGYVLFNEITPKFPEAKSEGGIFITSATATGQNDQSQATWGRVVSAGVMAARSTCEPFSEESADRANLDLAPGTTIMLRKANSWTVWKGLKALQCHDVVAAFPASWSWGDVAAEVEQLASSFKE